MSCISNLSTSRPNDLTANFEDFIVCGAYSSSDTNSSQANDRRSIQGDVLTLFHKHLPIMFVPEHTDNERLDDSEKQMIAIVLSDFLVNFHKYHVHYSTLIMMIILFSQLCYLLQVCAVEIN